MRLFDCAFFRKVVTRHDTGMGESYMDGDYEVRPLCAWRLLMVACRADLLCNVVFVLPTCQQSMQSGIHGHVCCSYEVLLECA